MSKFNTIGGIRLKRSGRVSKELLIKEMKIALDSLVEDFNLESFSGANLYLQIYNEDGDRLALISSDGHIVDGIDVNNIHADFSFKKIGCNVQSIKDIERAISERQEARRIEVEKRAAALRDEYLAQQQKEKVQKDKLNQLRNIICTEFGIESRIISEVVSSIGVITTTKGMSKYIKESQIPNCGYVYRASLKTDKTGKVSEIRIYDDNLNLLSSV